ncbi:MAG: SDR family NAD(P)-dependent oxidoreductase, partial [Bacillati bacterium ANGP1]
MGIAASDRPTALVTGANRGLGLETSNQLHAQGFLVILTSRKESAGIAAARKLDPDGKDVVYHQLDVTDALLPFIPGGGRVVMVSSGLGELSYLSRDLRSKFADPSLTRPSLDALIASYLSALEAGEAK